LPESRHRRRRGRTGPGGAGAGTSLSATRARPRKNSWLYIVASALIAVLVIGGFAVGATGIGQRGIGGHTAGTATAYVDGVGVQHDIMPTVTHVAEPQTVEYNSIPPTSGSHWPQWSNCGFYEEELADERVVHNLEHSNIVVSYNLGTPEEINQLRDVMSDIGLANVTGVTRAYSKIPVGTVALSAWGVSDTMEGVDKDRIKTFFDNYAGRLGPEGNIPCLNSGVTP